MLIPQKNLVELYFLNHFAHMADPQKDSECYPKSELFSQLMIAGSIVNWLGCRFLQSRLSPDVSIIIIAIFQISKMVHPHYG